MTQFRNVLVAVDLCVADRLVCDELAPPSAEAVLRGLWLAKLDGAASVKLRFFSTIDVPPRTQHLIESQHDGKPNLLERARAALQKLVDQAQAQGVKADCHVEFGRSWVQIIRCVLRDGHDLVIAGTRQMGRAESFLIGSTGIKLLRKCPCPVWIAQPQQDLKLSEILVAHDLRAVGDRAMELGCLLAEHYGAQLHVLHSVEQPELEYALQDETSSDEAAQLHADAVRHIETQVAKYEFSRPPLIHIDSVRPDLAILFYLEKHPIQLLVMGTLGSTGVSGFITGQTAERLLPRIGCSVLAVKPDDFKSPVLLE